MRSSAVYGEYCAECIIQRAEISSLNATRDIRLAFSSIDQSRLALAVTTYQGTALCTEHVLQAARAKVDSAPARGTTLPLEGEPNCGDVDPDEGACLLAVGHEGEHWHSMFGTPREIS